MMLRRDLPNRFRFAVDELGAELDGRLESAHAFRQDSTPDPFAGLEHEHVQPAGGEDGRGGEPRGAGTDDDDVRRHGNRKVDGPGTSGKARPVPEQELRKRSSMATTKRRRTKRT